MTLSNDSLSVTPGTGASVATQLVSGKKHQVVVLADQNGNLDPNPIRANKPYIPAASDILSGSVTVVNSTTPTTIITIPAGRTWYGNIGLEVLNTQNAANTPLFATITVNGTGATPASGTAILQVVNHRAGNTSVNFDGAVPWTYVAATTNDVTLQVTLAEANASHSAVAFCNGILL